MINFVISVKLYAKMHFLLESLKTYIFHQSHFIYVLLKKHRNKLLLATDGYSFMFNTFISEVNNTGFFVLVIHPLDG